MTTRLPEQAPQGIAQATQRILAAFRVGWKSFLAIHITASALTLLVLTPLMTLLMGWLLLAGGQPALVDEDILFFTLSPTGVLIMLVAGGLYSTVMVFQQAVMTTAAYQLSSGGTVSLQGLSRFLLPKCWPLFRLCLHIIGRTVLIASPFLVLSLLLFQEFLGEFDINYYLTERPPVFWKTGGLILLSLLAMTTVLLHKFSGWILALPLLVLGSENPGQALKKSHTVSASNRMAITLTLLTIFLLSTVLLGIVSLLADLGVDGVVSLAGESLQAMAYLLGGLLVLWLLSNLAITFFSNAVLSLAIIYFFIRLADVMPNKLAGQDAAASGPTQTWRLSWIKLASLLVTMSLLAGFALFTMMDRLDLKDHTMIIAHRGASAQAPENTLAALELAIEQQADWVEIDVQETRDGQLVVTHDSDLKKIGGKALKVAEATLGELQNVDIGSWRSPSFSDQRIPTLQQVLELCRDRVGIVIELKYYGQEKRLEQLVVNLVEDAGMQDQVIFMSLSYSGIQVMKSIRPHWPVGLLSSVAIGDITRLEVDFFAVNANFANRAFIKRVHKRGKKVMVWTVNDPVSISAMIGKGVDGIITDKPGLATTIMAERAGLGVHERIMIHFASLIGKQPKRPQQ